MDCRCLTTSLVEDIHYAVEQNKHICDVIKKLENATLPGIVEYGCLQWQKGEQQIPPLPDKILSTELGFALQKVRSELGLRKNGQEKMPVKNIDEQSAEFMTLSTENDLHSDEWSLYQARFNRSVQGIGFKQTQSNELQAALNEMAENALIHSSNPIAVLIGYRMLKGVAQFCVADVGIGVLASLRSCADYQHLELHIDAIRQSLRDGTSRFGAYRGGMGFRTVFKALASYWGLLRFRSGNGCIVMDGNGCDADQGEKRFPPYLPGFQVTVSCRVDGRATFEPLM